MSEPGAGRLSPEQLVDWLRLIRSENVGPRTFRQLVNRFGGAGPALEALPALAAKARGREIRVATRDEVLREIEATLALGGRFLTSGDPDYPAPLRQIDSAPPVLSLRGDAAVLARDCVALVGSRNASAAGLAMTERLARGLAAQDLVIASGLARGIDTIAHRAALESGTVGVLAGGLARPYPNENIALMDRIVARGGAVVTEMPLDWEPRGRDFPRRNRLVSGLALGVVVIEAARRSGSLITARFALEQGRELFAVPGSPLDPRAEGCNDLIRQGATLCASPEDVTAALARRGDRPPQPDLFREALDAPGEGDEPLIDELDLFSLQERAKPAFARPQPPPQAQPGREEKDPPEPSPPDRDARAVILALLGPSPAPLDALIRAAGVSAREAQSALLELDLEGRIIRHGTNLVSLR